MGSVFRGSTCALGNLSGAGIKKNIPHILAPSTPFLFPGERKFLFELTNSCQNTYEEKIIVKSAEVLIVLTFSMIL
jgi:hypothetical protein